MGVLAGIVITAIVQSSSITTGLCILLVQQNIMLPTAAIPVVIGANIGTTATALVASIKMQKTAQRVAVANLCFNTFGVVLFLPFLGRFAATVVEFAGEPGMAVAWAQLIFNLVMALTAGGPGTSSDVPAIFMYQFSFTRGQLGLGAASAMMMLATVLAVLVPLMYMETKGARNGR